MVARHNIFGWRVLGRSSQHHSGHAVKIRGRLKGQRCHKGNGILKDSMTDKRVEFPYTLLRLEHHMAYGLNLMFHVVLKVLAMQDMPYARY